MIHISQTMEDYVSFSKTNALLGKTTKRSLKPGDLCVARIIALSHKGNDPKIGLTMRQPGLGKIEWIKEDSTKKKEIQRRQKEMKKEPQREHLQRVELKGVRKRKMTSRFTKWVGRQIALSVDDETYDGTVQVIPSTNGYGRD